jgi:prepilin-type N-terminal cleavage/methylation domain-containing protein
MHVNTQDPRFTQRSFAGFTLIEVLIGLVLTAVVAGIGLRVFLRQHWTGVAQAETVAVQNALRGGMLFLTTELRELGGTFGDPDILAFAPESLTYRAMRGTGRSCARTYNTIVLDSASFASYRSLQAGRDHLLLHREGMEHTAGDDRWLNLPLLSLGTGSCFSGAGLVLGTTPDSGLVDSTAFGALAPVRVFEVMQVKLYQSGGEYWLGARSVSAGETIQPLIGPLTSLGLSLSYQDSTGASTTQAGDIRTIGIALRATSTLPARSAGGFGGPQRRVDSLTTLVALRNW